MATDYTNITLGVACKAVQAYNAGDYAGGLKNPDLDRRALALFADGLATSADAVQEQVRFIGVDYGGAAGFKAAYSLVPAIAADIWAVRERYQSQVSTAAPIMQAPHPLELIEALYSPFIKEIHGKRNWLVWATKFWHFLNSSAFPVLDSRVDDFFRTRGRSQSAEKYRFVSARFRDFASAHQDWLPALRKVDGGLAWSDNKLWDKMCYGIADLDSNEQR